jgi:hypothetical protein
VQAGPGRDDVGDARRALTEHQRVAGQLWARDRRLPAAAVLRDLEQVDLVGCQRRLEGGGQLGAQLRRGRGGRRGARDAVERRVGEVLALA